MHQPAKDSFWRFVLLTTGILALFSLWQVFGMGEKFDVPVWQSKTLSLLAGFFLLSGLLAFGLLTVSKQKLETLQINSQRRWFGAVLVAIASAAYALLMLLPAVQKLIGPERWIRGFVFWSFCLLGMLGWKLVRPRTPWLTSLMIAAMLSAVVHFLLVNISGVTDYPFALGWSETSRYYYPSLFLSGKIYGQRLPWPILHPSLHLLLVPPYFFDAPVCFHRLWQVLMRLSLVSAVIPALLERLKIQARPLRWFLAAWIFLYLFMGPVYFHLTIPVILVLWGYKAGDEKRIWTTLILASVWSGLSRLNWYPMPGMLMAVLYLLETPYQNKGVRYLFKPAVWFIFGTGLAFLTQRVYIALSGIPNSDFFYTSLSSDLLWYRLWPNASYWLGVLPGILIASLPVWVAMCFAVRLRRKNWHPLRWALISGALLVLFVGGIFVSMKIGGGVDIHNMDAYLVMLLVVGAYLVFGRYVTENDGAGQQLVLRWQVAAALVAVPVWFVMQHTGGFINYDKARTQTVLDEVKLMTESAPGEVLFITQRHLVATQVLDVPMVPEYERENLMEMAMGKNEAYLDTFRADMEAQRFAMIVVDPLRYRVLGSKYPFGEENNAWVLRVMKPILCNYREAAIFHEDQIALYVPQDGERVCP
ncbi:MAG: hypothetical protein Kow002_00130 [Anaerolineales bacterium]